MKEGITIAVFPATSPEPEVFEFVLAKLDDEELGHENLETKAMALMRFWNRLTEEEKPFIYFQEIPLPTNSLRFMGRFSIDARGIPEWNNGAREISGGQSRHWNTDGTKRK